MSNLLELKDDILAFARKLGIQVSEEVFKDFLIFLGDFDESMRRDEYSYETVNIDSIVEIVKKGLEVDEKVKIFVEPKHDGTQLAMKIDDKLHLVHKNGSKLDKQDYRFLFAIFVKYSDSLRRLFSLMREYWINEKTPLVVKMEIYGKEYTPFNVEKEPLNFSVFDVMKGDRYLSPTEFSSFPHAVEYIKVSRLEDIDSERILRWLNNKEGIMIKLYDSSLTEFAKKMNKNLLAFKYKPYVHLLAEEAKRFNVKIDRRLLSLTISEIINEYAKNEEIGFSEAIANVAKDHEELRKFIERNREEIEKFWNKSITVRSLLDVIKLN